MIPKDSKIYQTLKEELMLTSLLVISGLPGAGKSLYVKECEKIARDMGLNLTVIQWDIARKAFETDAILEKYPLSDGVIHNGVKLALGNWLLSTIIKWEENRSNNDVLLIEAPLVGHRFIELAKGQKEDNLERLLADASFVIPIPSKSVRAHIEKSRASQVPENAKTWMGAKPSVMLKIWKMICEIANRMGKSIDLDGQPPYDEEVYEFVFSKILQRRRMIPLYVNEMFEVAIEDESDFHVMDSLKATQEEAERIVQDIANKYPEDQVIDRITEAWWRS